MTTSQHSVTVPAGGLPHARLQRVSSDRGPDGATSGAARAALDGVLELVERRRLSATELRVLLRLVDREAGIPDLAEALGKRPVDITRAGRRLAMRGLIRWRHFGTREESRLGITPAGLATVRALLTAAREPTDATGTPEKALR